ncbi:unnamed protein product [Linum trigynum]|uniref:Uncharacterized protein n=1 Tax=Linum trigynum TaxID=586398 RepID=A0AAV2GTM8_9ROSI
MAVASNSLHQNQPVPTPPPPPPLPTSSVSALQHHHHHHQQHFCSLLEMIEIGLYLWVSKFPLFIILLTF